MTLVLESQLILFAETKQTTGWNILGERYEMRGICYIYLYNKLSYARILIGSH